MATRSQAVTQTPIELVAAQSLVAGSAYILQNVGDVTVNFLEADSAPASADVGFKLLPSEFFRLDVGATKVWVWTDGFHDSNLAIGDV